MNNKPVACGAVIDYCASLGAHEPVCTCTLPAGHSKGHLVTLESRKS